MWHLSPLSVPLAHDIQPLQSVESKPLVSPLTSLPLSPTPPPFNASSVAIHAKLKQQKKLEKRKWVKTRDAAEKLALKLGDEPLSTMIPWTIENTRELDETVSKPNDEEREGEDKEEICKGVPWRLYNGVGKRL